MAGINKAIIVGNLGRDPEIRYTPQGTAVCNFSVATSETWFDKASGEKKESTEWHKIIVWGKLAENCEKYLEKGRQAYIEGKLQTRSYEKDGQTRYTTEIVANTVQFLGSGQSNQNQEPEYRQKQSNTSYQQDEAAKRAAGFTTGQEPDDDIPF